MFVKLIALGDAPIGDVEAHVHPDDIRRIVDLNDPLRDRTGAPPNAKCTVVIRCFNNSEEDFHTSQSAHEISQLVRRAMRDRQVTITL